MIVIFALFAWRIRRNMVIVLSSLTVILVSSGFLLMDSWSHGNLPLAAFEAVVIMSALVVLGIVIRKLLSGMGKRPTRNPRHTG